MCRRVQAERRAWYENVSISAEAAQQNAGAEAGGSGRGGGRSGGCRGLANDENA